MSLAVSYGHESTARVLLEDGASVRAIVSGRSTLLAYAIVRGSFISQQLVESGARIRENSHLVLDVFLKGIVESNEQLVVLCIDAGMDVNHRNVWKPVALSAAAIQGHIGIVRALLNAGAKLDRHGKDGDTPLISAVNYGHHEVVRFLLDSGASVNATDTIRRTALSWSASTDSELVMTYILRHGADTERVDSKHQTPLHWAVIEERLCSISQLPRYGSSTNAMDANGYTPLLWAIALGHNSAVKCLLEEAQTRISPLWLVIQQYYWRSNTRIYMPSDSFFLLVWMSTHQVRMAKRPCLYSSVEISRVWSKTFSMQGQALTW